MTPDEYGNRGENLDIFYGVFESKYGLCVVASTEKGVCSFHFIDKAQDAKRDLKVRWPNASIIEKESRMHTYAIEYIATGTLHPDLVLHIHGTDFQLEVWETVMKIREGDTDTYSSVAVKLGKSGSQRAVGTAIGNNPIGYIIPCHRVTGARGSMGGYRWGIERKQALLAQEAIQRK